MTDFSPKRKSVKFASPPKYGIQSVLDITPGENMAEQRLQWAAAKMGAPRGILKIPKLRQSQPQQLWKACGRSLHFTTAFQSVMYEDTTLQGATRDRDKLSRTIQRMRDREVTKLERLELLQHKFEIAQQIEEECGVKLKEREIEKLSEMTLSKMLKRRYIKQTNEQAAVVIQRRWKRYWARKLFIRNEQRRHQSAIVIQNYWRAYLAEVVRPRQQYAIKHAAVSLLQRYIRGYMVERKVKRDIEKVKLDFCFGYFDKIRTKLLTNSQIVIRYNWLKYKKRKEEEERKRELKAQQKKKKSRYGVTARSKPSAGPSSTLTRDTSKASKTTGSKQLAASQPAKGDQRSDIKTPGTRQESRASNEQLKSRGTDDTKISSTGGGFNYGSGGGGLDETAKSRATSEDDYLMGQAGQRVSMEQVIDLEGTAPPSEIMGQQPETIQEEKEEELPMTTTGRAGGEEEMEGDEPSFERQDLEEIAQQQLLEQDEAPQEEED